MAYVITGQCIDELDGSCVASCPVDCIYEGGRKRYINPEECIDCGACLPECPADAIVAPDESPDPVWVADNAALFTQALPGRDAPLVSAGGAQAAAPAGADPPAVASWAQRECSGAGVRRVAMVTEGTSLRR